MTNRRPSDLCRPRINPDPKWIGLCWPMIPESVLGRRRKNKSRKRERKRRMTRKRGERRTNGTIGKTITGEVGETGRIWADGGGAKNVEEGRGTRNGMNRTSTAEDVGETEKI